MSTLRLFLGIATSQETKSQLREVIRNLKSVGADVKWEEIEKLHITMKFLGDTPHDLVGSITGSLEKLCANVAPFTLTYSGLDCFPHKREPRILWAGVEAGSSSLIKLAESIEENMNRLGFEREKKRFHPHVTLGRLGSQRNMRDLIRTMESITFESTSTTISEILLVKSELKPSGSVYTVLNRIPFSATQTVK